jgi:hypothetical protein
VFVLCYIRVTEPAARRDVRNPTILREQEPVDKHKSREKTSRKSIAQKVNIDK